MTAEPMPDGLPEEFDSVSLISTTSYRHYLTEARLIELTNTDNKFVS